MQTRSLFALLPFALLACTPQEDAKSAADPWADFKGTYSQPAAPREKSAHHSKGHDEAKAKAEPVKEEAIVETAEEATPIVTTPAPAKKSSTSRGMIKGESVSTISVDALTDASKGTLKQKFLSNSVKTGPQYEMVQVQLKGATVQIIRRAETPSPNGSAVASPKAKSAELGKNEASFYDEQADVLVVVSAAKKTSAQKALNTLVKAGH
jgi:hypothetical protein